MKNNNNNNNNTLSSWQVPGRLFPIELKYRPIKQMISDGNKKTHKIDPEPFLRVLEVR